MQYLPTIRHLLIPVLFFMMAFVGNAQTTGNNTFLSKTTDLPDWHIELWQTVVHYDHPTFARWSAPLGDINNDGYDDFAIATRGDTTFIFLGGDPFDHEPAFFIYGGGSGIAVGDFNGDGLPDLVTGRPCESSLTQPPCPKGDIRIYYRKTAAPYFGPSEDLFITGNDDEYTGLYWSSQHSGIQTLDFNGDGYADLLTRTRDWNDSVYVKAILFLGGKQMDAEYDLEYRARPITANDSYAEHMMTGDLNGDGYDDIIIGGNSVRNGRLDYWEIFFGNSWALQTNEPQRVISSETGWCPQFSWTNVMDVNGDGFDDIIDAGQYSMHRDHGDALVFLGNSELPEVILPNDSIPNNDPLVDRFPWVASPVGDMNGDGTEDLLLPWAIDFFPGASGYYFYPGGARFKTPTGYTGTVRNDYVNPGAYPAGDVNGDGYDDVLTLGQASPLSKESNRFQIHIGARQLNTTTKPLSLTESLHVSLSPNPVTPLNPCINIQISGAVQASVQLTLCDILGKVWKESAANMHPDGSMRLSWDITMLPAGVYFLIARQRTVATQRILLRL